MSTHAATGFLGFSASATRRGKLAIRVTLTLVLAAVIAGGLRRFEWASLREALRHARLELIGAAMVTTFIQFGFKSERWRLLLSPARVLPRLWLYAYLIVAYSAAMVLPGPVAGALRIYLLKKRHGVPIAISTAVTGIEKLFDGVGLIFVVAPLPFLLPLPRSISLVIAGLSVGGACVAVASFFVAKRATARGWTGRWSVLAPIAPSVVCLTDRSLFVRASALSFCGHVVDCVSIKLLLMSIGLELPWATGGFVVLALGFALLIPLTPGHVGALEAGAAGALGVLGAPLESAVAFALVYHAMRIVPMFLCLGAGARLIVEARAARAEEGGSAGPGRSAETGAADDVVVLAPRNVTEP